MADTNSPSVFPVAGILVILLVIISGCSYPQGTPVNIVSVNATSVTGTPAEPVQSSVSAVVVTRMIPDLVVNYSEIAYIGIQDPSDPVDENRKNVVAQTAIADERVRAILLDGGMIEGVLLQCHPTPKDSGGSACALALRVLHQGSNWDFLVDEKSGEVIFIQREVLPGRI
ncbi:hypothetical protein Metfor_1930 [Methanoregula formicica SMSP]|uniref:Uncharacterized protein n=2 Tax=Methanoregula formicica TaxID=882104 RepID=L0HHZ5_METFS|nr:hypothetical protein Metfor_1930 [Methanoregula formicica SMSP]